MKTILAGTGLLLFLVGYNFYLYGLLTGGFELRILRLIQWYSLLALFVTLFLSRRYAMESIQSQFINIGWIILFLTIIVVLLTNHGFIKNPYIMLGAFDCGSLIATITILIAGGKHGIFKK